MKILLLTRACLPFHGFGGMQGYVWNLGSHLRKRGHEVTIVAPLGGRDTTAGKQTVHGINYYLVGIRVRNVVDYFRFVYRLSGVVKRLDGDLIHCFGITGLFLFRWYTNPVLVQAFGASPCKVTGFKNRLVNAPICYALKYSYRRAAAIAVQGEQELADLDRLFGVDTRKAVDLPVGIDLGRFAGAQSRRAEMRKQLGISSSSFVLIYVGRLHRAKGLLYLLEAFRKLGSGNGTFDLVLLGAGSEEASLREYVRSNRLEEHVHFVQGVPDDMMPYYYGAADVCVMPSLAEGLPTVLLEALAAGLPAIATSGAGVENERVVLDGVNGILVPPADASSIAAAVRRLRSECDLDGMRQRSKEIVSAFDWASIAERAERIYDKLVRDGEGIKEPGLE